MSEKVIGSWPHGVGRKDLELITTVPVESYDERIAAVKIAASELVQKTSKKIGAGNLAVARASYEESVTELFDLLEPAGELVDERTRLSIGGQTWSYSSLRVSVPNPHYVAPKNTVTTGDGYTRVVTDWSGATPGLEQWLDVSREQALDDPLIGRDLVVHTDFRL